MFLAQALSSLPTRLRPTLPNSEPSWKHHLQKADARSAPDISLRRHVCYEAYVKDPAGVPSPASGIVHRCSPEAIAGAVEGRSAAARAVSDRAVSEDPRRLQAVEVSLETKDFMEQRSQRSSAIRVSKLDEIGNGESPLRLAAATVRQAWIFVLGRPQRTASASPCQVLVSRWNPSKHQRWRGKSRRSSHDQRRPHHPALSNAG